MRKQITIFILFYLWMIPAVFGSYPDSLQRALSSAESDTQRITVLHDLAYYYHPRNVDSAYLYAAQSLEISERTSLELPSSYRVMGISMNVIGQHDSSVFFLQKAVEFYSTKAKNEDYLHALNDLGVALSHTEYLTDAVSTLQEAAKISNEIKDTLNAAYSYQVLGSVYNRQSRHNEALHYFMKAMEVYSTRGTEVDMAVLHESIATTYGLLGIYDSALIHYETALETFSETDNVMELCYILGNIAAIHKRLDNIEAALDFFRRSYKMALRYNGPKAKVRQGLKLASYLQELKRWKESASYLDSIKTTLDKSDAQISIETIYYFHLLSATQDSVSGNHLSSIKHLNECLILTDSIQNKKFNATLTKMQVEFEATEKDAEILRLHNRESALKFEKEKKDTWLIALAIMIALLLLAGALTLKLYRAKQKALILSRENSLKLAKSHSKVLEQSEELHLINSKLENSVRERTEELNTFLYKASHDLRLPITNFMGLAFLAEKTDSIEELKAYFSHVGEASLKADKMIRKIITANQILNEDEFDNEFSIKLLIGQVLQNVKSYNPEENFTVHAEYPNLTIKSSELLITSILYNLIENAVLFGDEEKKTVNIQIQCEKKALVLRVTDNGFGVSEELRSRLGKMFEVHSNLSKGSGLGLYLVKKSLEHLKGELAIPKSSKTTWTVYIPHSDKFKIQGGKPNELHREVHSF